MDIAEFERLVEIVQDSKIRELTLKQGSSRITIRKSSKPMPGSALVPVEGGHQDMYEVETRYAGEEDDDDAETEPEPVLVTAPLVGVFKHVKPVIGLGAHVKAGQTIGVIEAMKLINEVNAPSDGIVTDVTVEDSMPVEYGQALFILRPGV